MKIYDVRIVNPIETIKKNFIVIRDSIIRWLSTKIRVKLRSLSELKINKYKIRRIL